jgi:hypothetical protein
LELERPITIVACRVFETLLDNRLPKEFSDQVVYLDYGLHITPKNLRLEVQNTLNKIEIPSFVVLGYGLCGNGLAGIKSQKHVLLIPKTDDCIAVLLGSYDEYIKIFTTEPGTYYLTKGWLEAGSNPLQEYQGYVAKYGQEKADMIMDMQYQNYTRLMFIAHDQQEIDHYKDQVEEIADFCQRWDMRYEERLGSVGYIVRLIEVIQEFKKNGNDQTKIGYTDDFVIIPPDAEVDGRLFMRG